MNEVESKQAGTTNTFKASKGALGFFDTRALIDAAEMMFDKIQRVLDWDADYGEFYEAIKEEIASRGYDFDKLRSAIHAYESARDNLDTLYNLQIKPTEDDSPW